jgi:hypothetical protein
VPGSARSTTPYTFNTAGLVIAAVHRVTCLRVTTFAPVLLLLLAPIAPASAQTETKSENRVAIGAEFKVKTSDRASKEDYARGQLGPGLLWRFGTPKPGWGFHWGLNWYAVKLERPIGGSVTELGELHIRPVMAGYGYTRVIRRYSITADVLGGYAMGSFGLSDPAIAAYHRALGVAGVTASATNTLLWKPEIGVWYDVNRKVYVNANAGYMMARPDVTIETAAGIDSRKARADQFILKIGIVYSLF